MSRHSMDLVYFLVFFFFIFHFVVAVIIPQIIYVNQSVRWSRKSKL